YRIANLCRGAVAKRWIGAAGKDQPVPLRSHLRERLARDREIPCGSSLVLATHLHERHHLTVWPAQVFTEQHLAGLVAVQLRYGRLAIHDHDRFGVGGGCKQGDGDQDGGAHLGPSEKPRKLAAKDGSVDAPDPFPTALDLEGGGRRHLVSHAT